MAIKLSLFKALIQLDSSNELPELKPVIQLQLQLQL